MPQDKLSRAYIRADIKCIAQAIEEGKDANFIKHFVKDLEELVIQLENKEEEQNAIK